MASIWRWTVLGCAVTAASAQFVKRGTQTTERWEPARQTDIGIMPMDPRGWTPRPTSAPDSGAVARELLRRDGTSTCGYYTGYSSSAAVVCQGSAQCIVNSYDSAMGCCGSADVGACQIYTSCLGSTEVSTVVSATGFDYTLLCTETDYPNCVTYSYDQYDPLYAGYSALGCGVEQGVYAVEYYAPFLGSAVTGSTRKTSSRTRTTATSGGGDGVAGSTSASSSSTKTGGATSTAAAAAAGSSSGNNTGAIVGGVVGGVAGLALIALGIFFLVRHLNKKKGANAAQQQTPPAQNAYYAAPGQPSPGPGYDPSVYGPGGPQMSQQQFAGGYPPQGGAAYDPRASMAPSTYYSHAGSPKYDNAATGPISPAGSPPPMAHTPSTGDYQAYNPAQGSAQYAHYNQQQGHIAELPASRPDGELRELA
ncbi:hypothetical protein BJ166DRAFT_521283 [Pestalotiopsis sp. NC0098]|nr:hypothetical protein BJ166DRAFT_521283 [Pestalotiopsis sp. NC0098]